MATILYVDDEPTAGQMLADLLGRAGHDPLGARSATEALQELARGDVDLIISDHGAAGLTGLEFLALVRREGYDTPMILLTSADAAQRPVPPARAGAVDFVEKPVRPDQLSLAVDQALELARLRREAARLRGELLELRGDRAVVATSAAMRRVMQTVATAAPTPAPVLLYGEPGVGKGVVARAIHDQSDRRDRPFVTVCCAALPDGLAESALFGYERGAFPGAARRTPGAVERADGGTLLLVEITALRLDLQARLLRVIEERELTRAGGSDAVRVDVRIIATTTRNLVAPVADGSLHRELYERLSVVPIVVPPLRDRRDDLPLLVHRFATRTAADLGKRVTGIAPDALALLQGESWPGNVRELQQAVERAVVLSGEPVLALPSFDGHHFGPAGKGAEPAGRYVLPTATRGAPVLAAAPFHSPPGGGPGEITLTTLNVDAAEAVLIQHALAAAGQNRTRAAELLGISVRTLRNKLNGPGRGDGSRE